MPLTIQAVVLTLVTALSTPPPVGAVPQYILGPIPASCGGWMTTKGDAAARAQYTEWILGFLSGLETTTGQPKLETTDTDSIRAWMDNFCASNPGQNLLFATEALWSQLRTTQAQ
jgi:hypothetical protein